MTREEELKKELEQIELSKKEENIKINLDSMKLVGKYFASHQLSRYLTKKPSYNFTIVQITGKEYEESSYEPYHYIGKMLHVYKDGDILKIDWGNFSDRNIDSYKYEITQEEFDTVINVLIPSLEKTINEVRNKFKAQEWISQGDHDNFARQGEHLDRLGIEFIDFSDGKYNVKGNYITLLELLRWNNHPFLYNSKLYKLPNWLEIVIYIKDEMSKHAYSWGGTILERDLPRIELLTKFIDTQK